MFLKTGCVFINLRQFMTFHVEYIVNEDCFDLIGMFRDGEEEHFQLFENFGTEDEVDAILNFTIMVIAHYIRNEIGVIDSEKIHQFYLDKVNLDELAGLEKMVRL